MEHITLYYRQGTSDKVYQASLEKRPSGYVVNFAYGRRGYTLTTGTKTPVAVEYDAAKAIYDKLVKEKTSKGYTPGGRWHTLRPYGQSQSKHRHSLSVAQCHR